MPVWQDLLDGYVDRNVPEPLVNTRLGLGTLDKWHPGYAAKTWPVSRDLFHGNALFGGYIAALADQMLGLAAMTVLQDDQFIGTTQMSINYLAPVQGGELRIEGRVVQQRGKSIYCECSFHLADTLVAKASATQIVYVMKPA
jgi:uncharacterized protein (TIGR00369 family)